jgi:hypothetical protein
MSVAAPHFCIDDFVPEELAALADPQTAIPAIAKDPRLVGLIEEAIKRIPTCHDLYPGDALRENLRCRTSRKRTILTRC